jgi:methyl-accepting chemotaxis protein
MTSARPEARPESAGPAERELGRWRERLAAWPRLLSGLVASREGDFLSLGGALQEFAQNAATLAGAVQNLAAMTGDTSLLSELTRLTTEFCESKQADGGGSLAELEAIKGFSGQLLERAEAFKRIVKHLQMLGISTRIESARLGQAGAGFTTLADDVDKLSEHIVAESTRIMVDGRALEALTDSVARTIGDIVAGQQHCSALVLGQMRENLAAISNLSERSGAVIAGASVQAGGISTAIGEVVTSVQFHDIVRQQLEHVIEALADMREVAAGKTTDAGVEAPAERLGWLAEAAGLQLSLLDNARERFVEAVESLRAHLREVSATVAAMTADVSSLLDSGGADPLQRLEAGVGAAGEAMAAFAGRTGELGSVVGQVAETVSRMSALVSTIEDMGAEIELIALNASIKAAHTGDTGRALGVLAQAIQSLSGRTRSLTDEVSAVLLSIGERSERLRGQAERSLDSGAHAAVITELGTATARLRELDQAAKAGLADVRSRGAALARVIAKTADGIDFHRQVAEGMARVGRELAELATASGPLAAAGRDYKGSARLAGMRERYTMDMERAVHAAALHEGAGRRDARAGGPAPSGGGDLGDNVELF